MTIIDGKRKLNPDQMHEFLSACKEDDAILVMIDTIERQYTTSTLRSFFEQQEFPECKEDLPITIASNDAMLEILGIDYNWWAGTRRLNKLFGGPVVKKSTKKIEDEPVSVNVIVGIKYEDEEDSVQFFEGSRKLAVEWLNKNYQLYSLKSFFKKKILVSIDKDEFKSIDEYVQEGRIVL